MNLNKRNARLAGLLYLLIVLFGLFAEFVVRTGLKVPGDAGATASNILENEMLYRLGFVSDLLCQSSHFFLVLVLYMMLKSVHQNAALVMLSSVLVSVSISFINMLNHYAPLLLLGDSGYFSSFSAEQLDTLSLMFLDLHSYGYSIAGIFFGVWLYPLGYLVRKSARFPKILGTLLMIACFGYIIDFFIVFLFPKLEAATIPGLIVSVIGELSFCFYLLIAGVRNVNPVTINQNR